MGKKLRRGFANAFPWMEMLLAAFVSWVVDRALDCLMKNRTRIRKSNTKSEKSMFLRLFNADARLLASLLELHPAEIKFCMYKWKDCGFFKGGLKSLTELLMYSYVSRAGSFSARA
jgi:hypothetical protein